MKQKSFNGYLHQELKKHWVDYGTLFVASLLTLYLVGSNRGDRDLQFAVFIVFAIYYVIWGAVHHIRDSSWSLKVLLEYILISGILLLLAHVLL